MTIGRLDDYDLSLEHGSIRLHGYWLHGRGVPPKYIWIDDRGHVVIVSSTYTTWLLQEADQRDAQSGLRDERQS